MWKMSGEGIDQATEVDVGEFGWEYIIALETGLLRLVSERRNFTD